MNMTTFFDDKFAYILSSGLSTAQRDQLVSEGWKYVCNPKSSNPQVKSRRCYRKPRTAITPPTVTMSDAATQTSESPDSTNYVSDGDDFDMYDQFWS